MIKPSRYIPSPSRLDDSYLSGKHKRTNSSNSRVKARPTQRLPQPTQFTIKFKRKPKSGALEISPARTSSRTSRPPKHERQSSIQRIRSQLGINSTCLPEQRNPSKENIKPRPKRIVERLVLPVSRSVSPVLAKSSSRGNRNRLKKLSTNFVLDKVSLIEKPRPTYLRRRTNTTFVGKVF